MLRFVLAAFVAVFFVSTAYADEACPDPKHVQVDEFIAGNLPPAGSQYVIGKLTSERAVQFIERFNTTFYAEQPVVAEGVRIISAKGYPNSLVIFTTGECATKAMFFRNDMVGAWLNGPGEPT